MTNRQSVRHRQAHRPCYIADNRLHLLLCMYYQTCWTALGPDCEYPLGHSNNSSMFYTLHAHPTNDPFPGLPRWAGTTWVSQYQKGKTNLHFTEARDSEWQWHQLGHMQVCTSLQTDNHASTPPLCFLQAGCPSCHPTNSVKALKAKKHEQHPSVDTQISQ